jgi:hypothetical protein
MKDECRDFGKGRSKFTPAEPALFLDSDRGGVGENETTTFAESLGRNRRTEQLKCSHLFRRKPCLVVHDGDGEGFESILNSVGLSRQERLVMTLYYREEMTQKEVGAVLQLTESRVGQIRSSVLLRLQEAMTSGES